MKRLAEGVETQDAWQRLTQLGCHVAQGYFLSRPVPADELGAWLRQRRAHHAQELHLEQA